MNYDEVKLTIESVVQQRDLALHGFINPLQLKTFIRGDIDAISLSFQQYFATQEVEKQEVTFPKTWVDAVLDRFVQYLPSQWRALFPIVYTTVKIEAKIMYPQVKIPNSSERYLIFKDQHDWVKND